MAKPLPLTVYGPITPISPAVCVTGVLPAAGIDILDNGTSIGHATASNPGELWVTLTAQPVVGHQITAVQKTADGTSDPSPQPILVIGVPDPLPVPVIFSDLNNCMVDIWAGGLVPGAKVITSIGGQPFGSVVAPQPSAWLGIDPAKTISPGTRAEVHQEAKVGSVTRVSKPVQSLPISLLDVRTDLLPPPVLGPLTTCDTSRSFLQVVPGAALTIVNEGQSEAWINTASASQGYGAPPLKTGKAVATQEMPRCGRKGQPATLPVGPPLPPDKPAVSQDLCPQVLRLSVSNLHPGGILHVYRRVLHDPSGSSWSQSPVGDLGIAYPSQPVDLPPDLSLTDPSGTVVIVLFQSRCTVGGPTAEVKVAALSGPFAPPRIVEPLFDCCRAIPVTGAHPGAQVQAFDQKTGLPISDPYPVAQADFTIMPWFPLAAGQMLFVRQKGCNADGDSHPPVPVKALPHPLPVPKIVEPVRPHAPLVKVTGAIPGARLHLLVNNVLRPGGIDTLTDAAIVPVIGAPLAENDRVFVIQTLCDQTSNLEGPGVVVTRGHLKVSVAPSQIARGTTANVVVTAVDADTGAPVVAQVLLNGKSVGVTGTPFSFSPHAGDPNPSGAVHEPIAYVDASFSITLVDPTWTLFLQTGPLPVFFGSIKINIDEITWAVTPTWSGAPPAKTITVKPAPPSATGSASLPKPAGTAKNVTATISGKASTAGGILNGYVVPAQKFLIGSDTRPVTFHGPNERIGWLLLVHYVAHPTRGGVFTVDPTFAGIVDVP